MTVLIPFTMLTRPTLCWVCILVLGGILVGCAPKGRYHHHRDSAPKIVPEHVSTIDALPVYEDYAPANMRPYTIRGVTYRPLTTGKGFSEQGLASWYGQKFHGHLTANGEIYNMYEMSAAHKTLPLPSFARVTNLTNGKQVVVRINDRGPFHLNRVVDLSYAAAAKLDILKTGVGKVKVDVIHVAKDGKVTIGNTPVIQPTTAPSVSKNSLSTRYIQVLASSRAQQIPAIAKRLTDTFGLPTKTLESGRIFKLRLGPLPEHLDSLSILNKLATMGYPDGFVVSE